MVVLAITMSTHVHRIGREGRSAASTLQTAYQYNHQSGTLHLPLASGGSSPVAIKAGHFGLSM